jgi:hypothetical protein
MGKFLFIGAILLVALLFGPLGKMLRGSGWRVSAGMGAIVAFSFAAFCLVEKRWAGVAILGILGLWLASSTRHPREPLASGRRPPPSGAPREPGPRSGMSVNEACSILGVEPTATTADIRSAYKRLMLKVHPDHGGAPGLAAQLNAARDRLLGKS